MDQRFLVSVPKSSKKTNRPLPAGWEPTKLDCSKDLSEVTKLSTEYRLEFPAAIGSLIYLTNTRPDIMYAVTKLAKFMRMPGRKHFLALIHLLYYLRDNCNLGLKYYRKLADSPVQVILTQNNFKGKHVLLGFHDSSWQDCPDSGKSTGSHVLFGQGGPIDFSSFVPAPVAMSSAEAENNAAATAGMAMSHIRMMWNEMEGSHPDNLWNPPILMLCDNKSAVTMINTEKDTKAQRHTKRRLMFSRQQRREKEIETKFLSNEFMLADMGTKNLDLPSFQPIRNSVMADVPD